MSAPARLPLPTRLHLELTNRCNSRCTTCVRTAAPLPDRDLAPAEFERIVDGLPELTSVALQVNGEPLLYRHLPDVIDALVGRGVFVELNSNGIALRLRRVDWLLGRGGRADRSSSGLSGAKLDSGLPQLNISLDAIDPTTYQTLRGVPSYELVVGNLTRFLARRGPAPARPRVSLWMTATRANLPDLIGLVELAARVGAEEVFLQRMVYFGAGMAQEEESVHGRLTARDRDVLATAQRRADQLGIVLRTCGRHQPSGMLGDAPTAEPWRDCRRAWEGAAVMADGDVVPCCISTFVAPREAIRMGNVLDSSWDEVWNGPAYRRHRELLESGPGPEYCRQCGVHWSL